MNDKGIEFTGAKNPKLSSPRSRMRGGGTEECKTLEMDLNPVAQASPDSHSPPPFGNARDSDNDSYYQYRKHVSFRLLFLFFLVVLIWRFSLISNIKLAVGNSKYINSICTSTA